VFLLTNDDGIGAPGIQALQKAIEMIEGVDQAILTIAPHTQASGCGHQVTTHRPIIVEPRDSQGYAVLGTPADCVRLGISRLCPEVQWVLSGINAGGNLGADVYISGTVAAVREAALHRIPSIAISHYKKKDLEFDWERATLWTARILKDLLAQPVIPGRYWNVNLPHLLPTDPDPAVVFCSLCTQPLPIEFEVRGEAFHYVGSYEDRRKDPGSDTDVCLNGSIAVTLLSL
jgi:5'-nucleotidase